MKEGFPDDIPLGCGEAPRHTLRAKLHDLNAMLEPGTGWELVQALAINNRGEILGVGAREGEDRIVLLRPKV